MAPSAPVTQRARATALLKSKGMARLSELIAEGVTASTVSRLEREGAINRLARGLYQLPDASIDAHHTLAEAAKLVPKGVICLTSALAYHELTDQIPAKVWIAIGPKDWSPKFLYPPARFAHFPGAQLRAGVSLEVRLSIQCSVGSATRESRSGSEDSSPSQSFASSTRPSL